MNRGNALVPIAAVALTIAATAWAVHRYHQPGHLDVVAAQAMDMSRMRPPTGAALVALETVREGAIDDTVTYTGSIAAYNEQDISPRITGALVSMPVYPGDSVRAGQLIAQLDTAEVGARVAEADAQADAADANRETVLLNHHLHHFAARDQANAQFTGAQDAVRQAKADADAAKASVTDAQGGVATAQANADYWAAEIAREKQLADAGAASRQEYQSELSQAAGAKAALDQAQAKMNAAQAAVGSANAKVAGAEQGVNAARSGLQMAQADITSDAYQIDQASAAAAAASASAREASVIAGYARIVAPANGVVIDRPVAPGTLVQPGTVLLRIAEIDRVRVQAHVAVDDLGGIHPGSQVGITFTDGSTRRATVTSVFPAADAESRTAVVESVIENPGHKLLPGAFATMRIVRSQSDQKLLVPAEAVVSQGGASYVWIAQSSGPSVLRYKAACGLIYSAADAKKYHYICPMDHKPLVPIHTAASPTGAKSAHEVAVTAGATDGTWTEVSANDISAGDHVVVHGQAGLLEGARMVETGWGPDGPRRLPSAVEANAGQLVYRCEKCGMTYSAADAKRNNYIDPMDGGTLVPVKPGEARS